MALDAFMVIYRIGIMIGYGFVDHLVLKVRQHPESCGCRFRQPSIWRSQAPKQQTPRNEPCKIDQDGLVGLRVPSRFPYLGPDLELSGLILRSRLRKHTRGLGAQSPGRVHALACARSWTLMLSVAA